MISLRQFGVRVRYFFRPRKVYDPLQPVFLIDKQAIKWRCKICDAEHSLQMGANKENHCRCERCGKKHIISQGMISIRRFLFPSKEDLIYVTRATLAELQAKIKGDFSRPIRTRLVYHVRYECGLAHKNYEVDGVMVALNSGVINSTYHDLLNLCEGCAGVEYVVCDRCGGRGDIPVYRHIQNGICFKCWGKGIEKVISVTIEPIN